MPWWPLDHLEAHTHAYGRGGPTRTVAVEKTHRFEPSTWLLTGGLVERLTRIRYEFLIHLAHVDPGRDQLPRTITPGWDEVL